MEIILDKYFLLDRVVSAVAWVLILLFLTRLYCKIKNKSFKSVWGTAKWVLFGLIFLEVFISSSNVYLKNIELPESQAIASNIDLLTSDEKQRFRDIMSKVMREPNLLTADLHKEFWELLKKAKMTTSSEIEQIQEVLYGVSVIYQRYFWEDARQALKEGRPFKSLQRENYEKKLKKAGLMADWRIKENEELIKKIATKSPVSTQGQTIVFDEELIKATQKNLGLVYDALKALFNPKAF